MIMRCISGMLYEVLRQLMCRNCACALSLLVCGACLCMLWLPNLRTPPMRKLQTVPDATTPAPVATPVTAQYRKKESKLYEANDCAPFRAAEFQYSNTYWQMLRSSRGVFYLYSAYLDVRKASRIGPAVRLLAVHDRIKPTLVTHCQLWFEERSHPVVVRLLEYKYMWRSIWGNYRDGVLQPYLLACVLPAEVRALRPAAVSLVEKPHDRATNCLRVHFDEPPDRAQKEFVVCVKGLDFQHEDLSVRLVEWIELVRLLGADKVFFYELQVHPNISRVLAYYRARGVVESTPITLPGGQPNLPGLQHMYLRKMKNRKRQMELVLYNDCLYRHMYQFRWLALLDIDEVIVPLQDPDWSSLLKRIVPLATPAAGKPPRSSYHVLNVYYLDQMQHTHSWEPRAPRYMHMLQHVYRTRNFNKPGHNVKAFHETGRVLSLHNHFPLACLGDACSSYAMDTKQARLHHYRADCVTALSKSCQELRAEPVRDAALWRWADQLVPRVTHVLNELGLLPPEPAPPQR